ncbi:hypothetical protein J4558_01230 [Leptolyngbya sp. 15MV]|nr:hypothetical protein J4558_01230 [Leptolyngbya sp. 15MV]
MNTKNRLVASAIAMTLALGVAVPASAQSYNSGHQFRQQIAQLEHRVDRTRGLSNREARQLDRQIAQLKTQYNRFARGGFDRRESQAMQRMIADVRYNIAQQARDNNNRYARNNHRRW